LTGLIRWGGTVVAVARVLALTAGLVLGAALTPVVARIRVWPTGVVLEG
jgi:hypothetical protein